MASAITKNGNHEIYIVHTFVVNYRNGSRSVTDSVELRFAKSQKLPDAIKDHVKEMVLDYFDEVIQDAVAQHEAIMHQDGTYSIFETGEETYEKAKRYVCSLGDTLGIEIVDDYTQPDCPQVIPVNVIEILLEGIEDRASCEGWDSDCAYKISDSIMSFVDAGEWQFGLCTLDNNTSKPAIWFGPPGSDPLPPWTITEETDQDDLAFWFPEDPEDTLRALIPDCYDSFVYWYLLECGLDTPDFEAIMESCPIPFSGNDSDEEIRSKISGFFESHSD